MSNRNSSKHQIVSLKEEVGVRRFSRPTEIFLATAAAILFIIALQWSWGVLSTLISESKLISSNSNNSEQLVVSEADPSQSKLLGTLLEQIDTEWPQASSEQVSEDLLQQASNAVSENNEVQLADSLALLGANALRDNNIDTAGVYLDEALAVYEDLENELGIANVEILRGERNIQIRENARRASKAYDELQIARWKVFHGEFHEVIDDLEHIVSENLALNRFGSAAAAYQTLYKGYQDNGQLQQAQDAGVQLVQLHASAGRPLQAQAMLEQLQNNGLDFDSVKKLNSQLAELQLQYEESVQQMGRAKDYNQLYNHYINAGDPVRAWQFRMKSQDSMRAVSERAMNRRQTGVLALVYKSNKNLKSAEKSLTRANELFLNNGQNHQVELSAGMLQRAQ